MLDIQFHGSLPFSVPNETELAPRWLALFFLPALALVLWAAFRAAPTAAGQRFGRRLFRRAPEQVTSPDQFKRFDKTYDLIVLGVVGLVLGMHAALLAAAFQFPALASRLVPLVVGAFLVLIGNVMPRLRPNWVAGLRTSRALADPQLWRSTHRAFGAAFVASGIVTLIVAVVAPAYGILTAIALLLVSLVVGLIASRVASPAPL